LVEESAALNETDVKELIGLSRSAVEDGKASKPEVDDLLRSASAGTRSSKVQEDSNDIGEDQIAALLDQLRKDNETSAECATEFTPKGTSNSTQVTNNSLQNPLILDDSAEVAAILSQLTDAAHLELKFDESDSESQFPAASGLSLPSVPKDTDSTDDDLSSRFAKLKSFPPKTYTGTDRGSINVFVPGISKTDDDETTHWCGMPG
jgi:hypothetical protein